MKKTAFMCGVAVALWASTAWAGLDLTWNTCAADGGTSDITVDCGLGEDYRMVGVFQVPQLLTNPIGMDFYLDFQVEGPDLSPFWHFETGGCNPGGLDFWSEITDLEPACTAPTPWNGLEDVSIISYAAGLVGPNRGRLICSTFMDAGVGQLLPGQDYYAFHLYIGTAEAGEGGGACMGCADKVAIVWNQLDIYTTGGVGLTTVEEPGAVGNCVGWNSPSPGICAATPAVNRTWGSIKARYR